MKYKYKCTFCIVKEVCLLTQLIYLGMEFKCILHLVQSILNVYVQVCIKLKSGMYKLILEASVSFCYKQTNG